MDIRSLVKRTYVGQQIWPTLKKAKEKWILHCRKMECKKIAKSDKNKKRIFYCGICEFSNMGDMAQTYCTYEWFKKYYPDYDIVEIKTSIVMDERCDIIGAMKKVIKSSDIIIFQCGYNTHDLGGNEDFMHQKLIKAFPDNVIIVLPQTVYFLSEKRRSLASEVYNSHKKMLFFVRDSVSEKLANEIFPDIEVILYPDIVTCLIGRYETSDQKREGICYCRRNDVEQFYTDEERERFVELLSKYGTVDITDTVINMKSSDIRKDLKKSVFDIINMFTRYRLVVTDKLHGLIFSLVANTPVIVLKTTDHKVTSVYEWFSKIYPDRLFYASDEEELIKLTSDLLNTASYSRLDDYFAREYYDELKDLIDNWFDRNIYLNNL